MQTGAKIIARTNTQAIVRFLADYITPEALRDAAESLLDVRMSEKDTEAYHLIWAAKRRQGGL